MTDLRGQVEVTQRGEGRVVDVTLTRAEAERLLSGERVELEFDHADVRFTDHTEPFESDDGEPAHVARVYVTMREELPSEE